MAAYDKEKRKNDERGRFPWWLLVVGFILGAAAMLFVMQSRTSAPANTVNSNLEGIELTATFIIEQATAAAQGALFQVIPATPLPFERNPLVITATALVGQVTQRAAMTSTAQANP
jgi:hypothetical protein